MYFVDYANTTKVHILTFPYVATQDEGSFDMNRMHNWGAWKPSDDFIGFLIFYAFMIWIDINIY